MRASRSPSARRARAGLAGFLDLAGLAGCGTFDDPSTVKDLRVLGVEAEPSEVILDVTDPADVASVAIPPLTLTPLIIDPAGRPVSVTVSACANEAGGYGIGRRGCVEDCSTTGIFWFHRAKHSASVS